MDLETAKQAVITVGKGRGFIIDCDPRLIVTAAHCLPHLPPAHGASYTEERTYQNLMGHIGEAQQTIWGECLFADPVADIAVIGEPGDQELSDQHDAFQDFVTHTPALKCGEPPPPINYETDTFPKEQARLLGLNGEWGACSILTGRFGGLQIEEAVNGIVGGMSGSPIINASGEALGVVTLSGESPGTLHTEGGPEPSLYNHLPGWLLASIN